MGSTMSNSIYSRGNKTPRDEEMSQFIYDKFGVDVDMCPRFRSWEISMDKPLLEVRGRFGGGNRDDYEDEIDSFGETYDMKDCGDDSYDCTYGYFRKQLDKDLWQEFKNKFEIKKKDEDVVTKKYN